MSDVRERLTEKALSALEALADIWASEVSLVEMCGKIASAPKIIRSDRVREMCIQCFVEGAYRARLDALAALDEQAREIAQLKKVYDAYQRLTLSSLDELIAERDAALAEVERLREDARRYRWLRAQHWTDNTLAVVQRPNQNAMLGAYCPSDDQLDAAIDAAIAEQEKGGA